MAPSKPSGMGRGKIHVARLPSSSGIFAIQRCCTQKRLPSRRWSVCTLTLTLLQRYSWAVKEVGVLGCINGLLVVSLSICAGWLSTYYQDRTLMTLLVSIGCLGMFLLIDVTDLNATPTDTFNQGDDNQTRYVIGFFIAYCSIQSLEGVIGSALSKVIPKRSLPEPSTLAC